MINYIRLALAAAVLAMAGGLFWQHQSLQAARKQAALYQGSIATLEASLEASRLSAQLAEDTILKRDQQLRKLQRQQAQRQKDLDRVLQDNRDWADQPVPPSVADWLRQRSRADGPAATPGATAGLPAP